MELPDNIRYLIEALRGGGSSTYQGGKLVDQQYGPATNIPAGPVREKSAPMPTRMRGYQLYNQEQKASGLPTVSYAEFMKMQGS